MRKKILLPYLSEKKKQAPRNSKINPFDFLTASCVVNYWHAGRAKKGVHTSRDGPVTSPMGMRRGARGRGGGHPRAPGAWLAAVVVCALTSWAAKPALAVEQEAGNQRSPWNKKQDFVCQAGDLDASWAELTASAGWPGRSDMGCVAFGGNIVVAGGQGGAGANFALLNDVWASSNALTWVPLTPQAEWKGRKNFGMLSYNKRLWILGGLHDAGGQVVPTNSIWSSADGIKWLEVKPDTDYCIGDACQQAAGSGAAVVTGETVVAASDGGAAGAVGAMWAPRHSMVTFDFLGKMFVVSGVQSGESVEMAASIDFRNDVWSSQDGVQWVLESAATKWATRRAVQGAVHQLRMYVLAESNEYRNYYNIWKSRDGKSWEEPTGSCTGVQLSPCPRVARA